MDSIGSWEINSILATQDIPDVSKHHKMFSSVYNKISSVWMEETNSNS